MFKDVVQGFKSLETRQRLCFHMSASARTCFNQSCNYEFFLHKLYLFYVFFFINIIKLLSTTLSSTVDTTLMTTNTKNSHVRRIKYKKKHSQMNQRQKCLCCRFLVLFEIKTIN